MAKAKTPDFICKLEVKRDEMALGFTIQAKEIGWGQACLVETWFC